MQKQKDSRMDNMEIISDEKPEKVSFLRRSTQNILQKTSDLVNNVESKKSDWQKKKAQKELAPMARSAPGNITGPTLLILGLILLACCLGFAGVAYFLYHSSITYIALLDALPLFFSIYMIIAGSRQNRHAEYFARYKTVFGDKPYASVQALADSTHQTRSKTMRNLKAYELEGLYPQGRFSSDNEFYVLSEGGMKILEEDLVEINAEKKHKRKLENLKLDYPQLYSISEEIEESAGTISRLRTQKLALRKPQLNNELKKTEYLLNQIRDYIIENPENVPNLKNFLDYFLPTLTRLLDTYCELDNEPLQTANIIESKEEIESSLQTINTAFENMYNDF